MKPTLILVALLTGACEDSTKPTKVNAGTAAPAEPASIETARQQNLDNELINQGNGARVLRLEGNDSVTFVGGELVEVNRVP